MDCLDRTLRRMGLSDSPGIVDRSRNQFLAGLVSSLDQEREPRNHTKVGDVKRANCTKLHH